MFLADSRPVSEKVRVVLWLGIISDLSFCLFRDRRINYSFGAFFIGNIVLVLGLLG